jgi:hypothetical protein
LVKLTEGDLAFVKCIDASISEDTNEKQDHENGNEPSCDGPILSLLFKPKAHICAK